MARAAQIYEVVLTANQSQTLLVEGSFFKILSATGTVSVGRDGGSTLKNMVPGQGEKDVEFKRLQFTDTSGAGNTVVVVVADNTFIDDRVFGTVTVTGSVSVSALPSKTFGHVAATVTTASAFLLVSNPARQYLLVQNNGTGNIWVRTDNTAATAATGVKIPPGGFWEIAGGACPVSGITAIGDIASNPNIVVVQA